MDGTKRERKDGRWGTMGKTQGSEVLNHKLTYYHLKWAVKSPGHLNYCDTKTPVDSVGSREYKFMTFGQKSKLNVCLLSLKYVEGMNGTTG